MHRIGLIVCAAAVILAAGAHSTRAQNYPWCMVDDLLTGSTSCAFVSFEQCRATASGGNIGHCVQNPSYRGPSTEPTRKVRRPNG